MAPRAKVDVGVVDVHQFAARRHAEPGDVDEQAADIRPAPGDGAAFVDLVGAERAGIDVAGDAILQRQRRTFLGAGRMGVDVDEAGYDELAAGIDGIGGIAGDVRRDGHDAAAAIATSRAASMPSEGSITRPPLINRS